jgi:hypothetical protein
MSLHPAADSDYPRTYRAALWLRLLVSAVGVACFALAGALAFLLGGQARSSGALAGVALLVLGAAAFGVWMIAVMLRSKIVLTGDAVEVHGLIRVRRLAREGLAGRRVVSLQYGQKLLVLSANDPRVRDLRISSSSIRTDAVWDAWIGTLPDLDARDAQALEAEVAANAELGQTPEERLARLGAAKKLANALNVTTYAVAAWGYIYPRPYALAMLALGVLPWIAILLVAKSSGLIRVDSRRGDPRPTLAIPVIIPGLVLMMRALMDVGVLDIERALIFAAMAAALLTWAAIMSDAAARARPWSALLLLLLLLGCAYGYGAVVLGDRLLDSSPGENFRVGVLARHVSRGRNTSYHLTLERWGPRTEPAEVRVSRDLYLQSPPGSTVCVHRGPGALGISWYDVFGCGGGAASRG